MIYQSVFSLAANNSDTSSYSCDPGGVVLGGSCGSADGYPEAASILVNGSGLSGDGTQWLCKVINTDQVNAHNVANGVLCNYPAGAPSASTNKPNGSH